LDSQAKFWQQTARPNPGSGSGISGWKRAPAECKAISPCARRRD
jgi:hypothetical protein